MDANKIIGIHKITGKPVTWGDLLKQVDDDLKPIMEERERNFKTVFPKLVLDELSKQVNEKVN